MAYLNAIEDALVDRTSEELIGAILVALALALAVAGVYALARRNVSDRVMLMTCLVLSTNVVSMALAAGYLGHLRGNLRRTGRGIVVEPRRPPHPQGDLARRILELADTDRDGILTAEEASRAAARFVESAGASGRKGASAHTLSHALQGALFPPVRGPGLPPGSVELTRFSTRSPSS